MKILGREISFIEGINQAWKLASVQLAALLTIVSVAYEYLPVLQANLPDGWSKWFGVAIIVGRIIQQKNAGDAGR